MAGRQFPFSSSSSRSSSSIPFSLVITILSLLTVISLYSLFSSSTTQCIPNQISTLSINPSSSPPEYSFVASLEKFLHSSISHPPTQSTTDPNSAEELDDRIRRREAEILDRSPFPDLSVVRVYVYEMPAKFTYDLLWLFLNTYRDTTNLTSNGSPVHRLIEQHSIDYWLWSDLIAPESQRLLKNVIRVRRQGDADFFYIPFFTTISFFLLEKQQCKALYRVCAPVPRRH